MKRIDTLNARTDLLGIGKAGFHDNADLPGQDATYLSPEWLNHLQEELCNVLELNGVQLDPDLKNQLANLLITKNNLVNDLVTGDPNKALTAEMGVLIGNHLDVLQYCPIAYPKTIPPTGYLAMMGQAITQDIHPKLYALYGANLPDLRAYSIRGLDNGRGIDLNRNILSEQGDTIRNILGSIGSISGGAEIGTFVDASGAFNAPYNARHLSDTTGAGSNVRASVASFDASRVVPTAAENRVKNIAFLYIVKAG